MKLAIGDVVRVRDDKALGTVAGITDRETERLVLVRVPGGGTCITEPRELTIVARPVAPMTTGRSVVALFALGVALVAGFISCRSAQELGASWALTLVSSLGGFCAVMITYQWCLRLTGPRRFRV
ncbi:hypothetical protein ACFY2W_04005 [Streptomyces sp. NPDC001262]|uniref:hypothetical protein n=1 Tax=Streptomyces sp. NPDC001262 TaxID=3364552 RepID=UPI00367DB2FC